MVKVMMFSGRKQVKHGLRSILDRLAAATGLLQWHERRMRRGLTILMYHRVLPWAQCRDYPLPSLVIPPDVFRQQMQWLAAHCRVLPVREALAELAGGGPFAKPLVSVTFDDGYEDNFTLAAPLLEEWGLHGTFFVTTGFVAEGRPLWYDLAAVAWQGTGEENRRLLLQGLRSVQGAAALKSCNDLAMPVWMEGLKHIAPDERLEMVARAKSLLGKDFDFSCYRSMSQEQVRELHQRGHEIASHTVSHPVLPQLSDTLLEDELQRSAARLQDWIGTKVTGFCYPNGDYDLRVEQAVMQSGYVYACTVEEGVNLRGACPTRLTRLPITRLRTMRGPEHDPLGFRAELCRVRALWRR